MYSTSAFKELGLTQSEVDPCLWYGKDLILVQYVDDCGIAAPKQEIIDKFVEDLRKKGFELTQEGSFSEFLGIKFDKRKDGSIEMTQKGLIKKVLAAANMTDCNPAKLPGSVQPIGSDKDGKPMNETWNYRAIIGMLLYLSGNTRTDIALTVSMLAKYAIDPKESHAKAVKTLLRYLKGTADKGTIYKPTEKLELDLYVDADFCGMFKVEPDNDPKSAKSRTGYIAMLCGCPVLCNSKLQTCTSQSTLEAEYVALSSALRAFIPLKRMVEEMVKNLKCSQLGDATIHARVFEDNQGAFYLATNQRITSRTKYFLVKYHWFWETYDEGRGFSILKCPTDKQRADYLTKQLPFDLFWNNRKAVQGW